MKNDIDALLDSMFRGGKLQFKNSADQAQKALDQTEKTGDALSRSLEQSIQQLTREAKADMADLELHLKADGVKHWDNAQNGGSAKDLDVAFETARLEAISRVLGQDAFVADLVRALKRPFVAGSDDKKPLCRGALLGAAGTGRHSALEVLIASLARQGVLKGPKIAVLDLGKYPGPDTEKFFLQDVYAALKSGASALVLERYEDCHSSVLALVAALLREGSLPLPGRYVEQKGMLVDIGAALVPGAVSSLSAAGKYVFLLSEKNPAQLADSFGAPLISGLDDICQTSPFAPRDLEELADRTLKQLCEKAKKQLGITLRYTRQEVQALAAGFSAELGAESFLRQTEALYRALSEYRLRQDGKSPLPELVVAEKKGRLYLEGPGITLGMAASGAPAEALDQVKRELGEIVGLEPVKEYILSLEDNFKIQQLRKERGLKAQLPAMHMLFTGNPGTGKTTMARLVSRYLKAIGVLSGGQLVEVTRGDLVGQYVGHTAPLTQKAIQSALGGVLFIDEAYGLYRGRDDSFGLEAIDTLVKGIEDHRDNLVVILAGYSKEMEEFLTANSGLKSRFPHLIEFPDYTGEELLAIAESIVRQKGYRLDPACKKPLLEYFVRQQRDGDPRTGGNGRMARNKVEEAILACSRRNVKIPEAERDLELLLPEDFGI